MRSPSRAHHRMSAQLAKTLRKAANIRESSHLLAKEVAGRWGRFLCLVTKVMQDKKAGEGVLQPNRQRGWAFIEGNLFNTVLRLFHNSRLHRFRKACLRRSLGLLQPLHPLAPLRDSEAPHHTEQALGSRVLFLSHKMQHKPLLAFIRPLSWKTKNPHRWLRSANPKEKSLPLSPPQKALLWLFPAFRLLLGLRPLPKRYATQ